MIKVTESRNRSVRLREFLTFFAGSAAGLVIDLAGFQLLAMLGFAPWLANAISSVTSVSVVYLLVSRYSFGVGVRPSTYVLFVSWYGMSILLFSFLIQTATTMSGLDPFLWKLCSVPVSFAANYMFSRFLFRGSRRRTEMQQPETAPSA